MRQNSATDLYELIIDCPTCAGTGWVQAVTRDEVGKLPHLTIECSVHCGHSWVPAVGDDIEQVIR